MDAFLSDTLDVTGVDPTVFLNHEGGLSHSALMRDERLVLNAVFRFAWTTLSGGPGPSARCFAGFAAGAGVDPNPCGFDFLVRWLLSDADGPFYLLRETVVMRDRLALLRSRFGERVRLLRDPGSGLLHRVTVEKLVDRHLGSSPRDRDGLVASLCERPLFVAQRDLASSPAFVDTTFQLTNLASGMVGSIEEEDDVVNGRSATLCRASVQVGRADAIKRRFSRDLHFQCRQFARNYVTASSSLAGSSFADVVRTAIDAPWVVEDGDAIEVERHAPVIASRCVRLHAFDSPTPLRPPARVTRTDVPNSALIVFGAGPDVPDSDLVLLGVGYQRIFRAHSDGDRCGPAAEYRQGGELGSVVYPLYFGAGGVHHWSYGLMADCLTRHLETPVDSSSGSDASRLLVDRCILLTALARGFIGPDPVRYVIGDASADRVILAIDSRVDPSSTVMSVAMALSSLADPSLWHVRVMCSRVNLGEFRRMLDPICAGEGVSAVSYDASAHELNLPAPFDVQSSYNALMKDPRTWRSLLPAKVVLTVQDDGLLMRPGIEALLHLDGGVCMSSSPFIGAPWVDHPVNAPLKAMVPSLIGNGGLSLRDVGRMIVSAEGLSVTDRRRLFHTRMEPMPEDVTFSRLLPTSSSGLSCEQVPCDDALGFHKPWPYWTVAQTHAHMERIIRETSSSCRLASSGGPAPCPPS